MRIGTLVAGALTALVFNLSVQAQQTDLREPAFDYTDIDRFAEAIVAIDGGTDPVAAFERYLDGAGPGLYGWGKRYRIPAESFARAYKRYPNYFHHLSGMKPLIQSYEEEIAEAQRSLRTLFGDPLASILPTYYFVSPMGGGGSAEAIANMVAIDYFGRTDDMPMSEFPEGFFPESDQPLQGPDALAQVAVHEMVHWYQSLLQGEHYVAIYRDADRGTIAAYAIREGAADFLAYLADGGVIEDRHVYGEAHWDDLWAAFEPVLDQRANDQPGWFHGRLDSFPDAPWQIGYYMGFMICQGFYEASDDKNAAVAALFGADTEAEFDAIIDAYLSARTGNPSTTTN